MEFNFDDFKVQGTKFNYYYICKRKLWLFSKGICMESDNDRVQQGRITHEDSYKIKEVNKEKLIDGIIKIDKKLNNVAIFKLNTFLTKIYVNTKAPSIIIILKMLPTIR